MLLPAFLEYTDQKCTGSVTFPVNFTGGSSDYCGGGGGSGNNSGGSATHGGGAGSTGQGADATSYGSGGGGSARQGSPGSYKGGDGHSGVVIISTSLIPTSINVDNG